MWEIFSILYERHFLDYEASLGEPIDFYASIHLIDTVLRYLSYFDSASATENGTGPSGLTNFYIYTIYIYLTFTYQL